MDEREMTAVLLAVATGDPAAPALVRKLAERLYSLAERLEARDPFREPSGVADRVRINVVGPDDAIKQQVDTQPGS